MPRPEALRRVVAAVLTCVVTTPAARAQDAIDPPAYAHGAVAADHPLASRAGVEILRAGGNAVDAAVAVSFALSVVRPESCGIGGGGFMLIRLVDDPRHGTVTIALNYREQAPAAAEPGMFADGARSSTVGGAAVAIPGTVNGLLHALETYGTMGRDAVLAPAIGLAEEGWPLDAYFIKAFNDDAMGHIKDAVALDDPAWNRRIAARQASSRGLRVGDVVPNPEQARALRLIAERGRDGFTAGPVGEAIIAAIAAAGGSMTAADLASHRVQTLEPLRTDFRGLTYFTMPPPSSGGIVIGQVLGILNHRSADLDRAVAAGHNSAEYIHLITEAGKHAFADRARWLADPAFADVPTQRLLSDAYLKERADLISLNRTLAPERYGTAPPPADDAGTSHFSVADARGNAVACTETINLAFGSKVFVPEAGIYLNNQMDDFAAKPGEPNAFGLVQSRANAPEPGKRPLSSMSPTIALTSDGRVAIVAGASGGPRIISGTLQAMLNIALFGMDARAAVGAPRFHHQWMPDRLRLEKALLDDTPLTRALSRKRHRTDGIESVSHAQVLRRVEAGWQAASDPRKGGEPDGY